MNCQHASELISQQLDNKLTKREQIALRLHLLICPRCRHFQQNSQKLQGMLKRYCEYKEK